ncbi:response regulator transcription factor [Pedobacter jejuensis]|uniref:LuxR family transcriptional regulator n=1 Tax=Pedobacter jejuensis TaxID=1268550 RepID=A0A3N0BNC0_9SPHI|nr:helix-turn-helix transcriptional regulator [Pedobacter jejuensis]RNL50206.1 LuxR family transcriptional regulator [Pedobacter jejuensis]
MVSYHKPTLTAEMHSLIDSYAEGFNQIPGVVILHETENWTVVYMSDRGLAQLKLTLEQVCNLTNAEYYSRYFNEEDAKDYVPKIGAFMHANNKEDTLSYYQQLKFPDDDNWRWHLSSTNIFLRDNDDKPVLTITVSIPIDAMHHMAAKADKLLEENNFLRKNVGNFSKLSRREKTILKEISLGKSSIEIASELHISSTTVDTHRRNIRDKLNAKTSYEIAQYARAFDLI